MEQGSISPTFYMRLLPAQIQKGQKIQLPGKLPVFLRFWDLRVQKLCIKLTPGVARRAKFKK
jgi:hypothetical protein